jgi:hypothetical protein
MERFSREMDPIRVEARQSASIGTNTAGQDAPAATALAFAKSQS